VSWGRTFGAGGGPFFLQGEKEDRIDPFQPVRLVKRTQKNWFDPGLQHIRPFLLKLERKVAEQGEKPGGGEGHQNRVGARSEKG